MNRKIIFMVFLLIFTFAAASCKRLKQVSGQVWQDNNNDGLKGSNEPWLSDVKVSLYKVVDGTASEAGSKVTNNEGQYLFDIAGEETADWEIRVTAPDGAQFTKQNVGTGDELDSDVNASGNSEILPAQGSGEQKLVNAGLVTIRETVVANNATEPDSNRPTKLASTPVPTTTPSPAIAAPLTTTLVLTSPVSGPDSRMLAQQIPDGLNDSVDCQQTLAPTNQELLFDITEAGWLLEDDDFAFFLQFDHPLESSLEEVGDQDFLGLGWGMFDPQSEIFGDSDPTWLANIAANKSFDVLYDPESGSLIGTLFMVQDGTWIEVQDVEYPVETAGSTITMTVPVSDISQNARGFATAVYFDAEEGQLDCDWAGVDEIAFRKTLEDLAALSEIIDPEKMAFTYAFDLSEVELGPDSGSLPFTPSVAETYAVTTTVISGEVHEFQVNLDPRLNLTVTQDMIISQTIFFQGQGAWVDVTGQLADDGHFFASGSGEVAGFSGIDVTLVGTMTKEVLIAEYTMGKSGKLPGGESIVYDVTGIRLPEGQFGVYTDTISTFIDDFNNAFQSQNVDYLYEHLHPLVIDLYGPTSCENYLIEVVVNPIFVQSLATSGPERWVWERDGQTITVEDAYNIEANVSFSGQTQQQDFHVAAIGDDILWFTDCGDPLR